VLRNPLDTNVSEVPGSAMINLFDGPDSPMKGNGKFKFVRKPVPQYISIEVLHGTQRVTQKFPVAERSE